jgi:hypothetical protein
MTPWLFEGFSKKNKEKQDKGWKDMGFSAMFIFVIARYLFLFVKYQDRGSIVSIETGYRRMTEGLELNAGRVKNFHFSITSRLTLGSTHPPIQWALEVSFLRVNVARA